MGVDFGAGGEGWVGGEGVVGVGVGALGVVVFLSILLDMCSWLWRRFDVEALLTPSTLYSHASVLSGTCAMIAAPGRPEKRNSFDSTGRWAIRLVATSC